MHDPIVLQVRSLRVPGVPPSGVNGVLRTINVEVNDSSLKGAFRLVLPDTQDNRNLHKLIETMLINLRLDTELITQLKLERNHFEHQYQRLKKRNWWQRLFNSDLESIWRTLMLLSRRTLGGTRATNL